MIRNGDKTINLKQETNGLQDASDFNVTTSSLHALSNSMTLTRNDKQSPHSSPRMTRRSATPNIQTQTALNQVSPNEIYASQLQQQQQQQQQPQPQQQQQPQINVKHTVFLVFIPFISHCKRSIELIPLLNLNLLLTPHSSRLLKANYHKHKHNSNCRR